MDEFNRRIIKSAPISIMILDKKGNIVFVNEHFKELSKTKIPTKSNIFNIPFFVKEKLSGSYRDLLSKGTPIKKEACFTTNSKGKAKYINIVAVPLKDRGGEIEGALSMAVDVTETVSAKIELQDLNLELESRVAERTKKLFEVNRQLNESLELKQQFIADASHELKTPLSIMKLNIDMNKEDLLCEKPETKVLFSMIRNEIAKINEILDDLSLATMIDGSEKIIKTEKVDVDNTIDETVKRLSAIAQKKRIDVIWKKSKKKTVITGDKAKLEKLFLNLIRNAIKYGVKNGWIKVELARVGKFVRVKIADNGIGIPKKELPNIFERFYRSTLSRQTGEGGFGLGLSICKWIVDLHGGSIDVESEVDKGSVFRVKLPSQPLD